jgi:hypothetical protein
VNTNFFYYPGEGNAAFNYGANVELGLYVALWNVIQSGIVPAGAYQVATTVSSFNNNTEAPLVLGNLGAILAVHNTIQLRAQKQNEKIILNWSALALSNIDRFMAERSADGQNYSTITEMDHNQVSYTDQQPLPGLNYYRIKAKEIDGKTSYSNIVVILNAAKGSNLVSIAPNPVVNGSFKLNISAAQKMQMNIVVTDMQGRPMQEQMVNLSAGFNTIPVNVANLARGTYQVYGNTPDGRSRVLRFVVQ